jgi:hypothetical protein
MGRVFDDYMSRIRKGDGNGGPLGRSVIEQDFPARCAQPLHLGWTDDLNFEASRERQGGEQCPGFQVYLVPPKNGLLFSPCLESAFHE